MNTRDRRMCEMRRLTSEPRPVPSLARHGALGAWVRFASLRDLGVHSQLAPYRRGGKKTGSNRNVKGGGKIPKVLERDQKELAKNPGRSEEKKWCVARHIENFAPPSCKKNAPP